MNAGGEPGGAEADSLEIEGATPLAEGLYAEKPKKFIARIGGYWASWR